MRIVFTTLGSVGDIRPLIALAHELRQHGHESVFALPPVLMPYAQQFGFEVIQLGPDLREEFAEALRLATRRQIGQGTMNRYEHALLAALPQALQQLLGLCSSADLLISANVMPLGRFVHDMTGIPFVSVQLWYPLDMPTLDEPTAQSHPLNQVRAQMGLPQLADPLVSSRSPQLELIAISCELLPPGLNWAEHQHVTGFWIVEDQSFEPDPALTAFLAAGPPPVLIALGSTLNDDPAQATALFVQAVEAVGCRAIIQQGWTGLGTADELSETILLTEYVSYDWLFPQLAGVVHHGGAGTAATALRHGLPAVVIPHLGDQFPLGQRLIDLGCASATIPFQELSVERLQAALTALMTDSRYREAARTIGRRIAVEQGVQTARALIEQLVVSTNAARS